MDDEGRPENVETGQESPSLDAFHARRGRRSGDEAVWKAIDDLALQVSTVRHDVRATEMKQQLLQYQLLGFEDDPGGGRLGALSAAVVASHDRLNDKLEAQGKQIQALSDTIRGVGKTAIYVLSGILIIVGGALTLAHLH